MLTEEELLELEPPTANGSTGCLGSMIRHHEGARSSPASPSTMVSPPSRGGRRGPRSEIAEDRFAAQPVRRVEVPATIALERASPPDRPGRHDHADPSATEPMPGMLTEEELLELEAADGERFDRLFLGSMIRHHEGALEMVDQLHAAGGGEEPEIARFAIHVQADQSIELGRMHELLATLDEG
jgi:uncharacterized protein (DUF305 family)